MFSEKNAKAQNLVDHVMWLEKLQNDLYNSEPNSNEKRLKTDVEPVDNEAVMKITSR